jgi:hypothetical protein
MASTLAESLWDEVAPNHESEAVLVALSTVASSNPSSGGTSN